MKPSPPMPLTSLSELHALLSHRLAVIGDKKMREESPAAHLEELKKASEAITAWHQTHRAEVPARLNHYLTQASFQKALAWIDTAGEAE